MSNFPEDALLAAWHVTLTRRRDAVAVWDEQGTPRRTFAQIAAEAHVLAGLFSGLVAGTIVALQLGNSEQWPALLLALLECGLVPLPLGQHMAEGERQTALQTCGAAALLTLDAGSAPCVTALPGPHATPGCDFLKLTSGTTGAPRGVRFQAHQLVADCEQICATMGIHEGDLNYGVIPVSHSYGFSNLLLPLLCRGVPLVLAEDRLPRAVLQGLLATGATVFPGTPVFFDRLATLEQAASVPRLRLCISAGAPLSVATGTAFSQRTGLKVHTFYGSSECGGIAYDASQDLAYEAGFVGKPMQGVELSCAGEEPARLHIRSAAVGEGYYPVEEPEVLGGGAFSPGDLVRRTLQGLYLAGRASDTINIAGRKLHPAEVETQLAACPGVRQAMVFGVPSTLRGEEPVACVVGEGLTRAALQRFCQERLSPWQVPRDFWIVPELPANDRGKTGRRDLLERYLAQR